MQIDTSHLSRRLTVAHSKLKRVIRNALNDSAVDLRKATPAILQARIDRPAPFTLKPNAILYKRADYGQGDSMFSSLIFAPAQGRYLIPGEKGTESRDINQPIRGDAYDKHGNILKGYSRDPAARAKLAAKVHRIKSKGGKIRTIGQYFVGKPHGRYASAGLFYRSKDGRKISRISRFVKVRQYTKRFGIEAEWARLGGPILDRHYAAQAAHPENQV